jgi:BlaI family transcriptional regulator, penicillinase repressor
MDTPLKLKPTESELEILNILWDKGTATVREIHEVLEKQKPSGYTTTLKLMQIMFEKGMLSREAQGKMHVYAAVIKREKAREQLVQKMIDTMFSGSASQLIMQALGNHHSSQKELDEITAYLNKLKDKNKPG